MVASRALKGTVQAEWHTADFLSFATSCQEEYDCILMSFAMHHLTSNEKAEILVQCHRLLQNRCRFSLRLLVYKRCICTSRCCPVIPDSFSPSSYALCPV